MTLVGLEGEVVLQLELHPLRSLGEGCEASSPQSPTLASLTTLEEQQAPDPRGLHHSLTLLETAAGQPGGRGRR